MATMLSSLSAAQTQIRGPALVGPGLQIRGPGLLTGQCETDVTDFTARFTQAVSPQGAVGILMADDVAAIQQLAARWPVFSETGWLVGTQTNAAELQEAYDDVGDGSTLRILIARRLVDVVWLCGRWPNFP